jgi:small subunit ribosomal protein S17
MSDNRGQRKTATGTVEKDPKDKTIAVKSVRLVRHPRYHKFVRRISRIMVHDEKQESRAGDIVEIMECRPISKTKSWRLLRIISSRTVKGSEETS